MQKTTLAALLTALLAAPLLAQSPTPVDPPKSGGTITGDAANGGPVGNTSAADIRDNGYNTGGATGGSTSGDSKPTPTPSATPRSTPQATSPK